MKRDCGEGELIPNHYKVRYHLEKAGKELKKKFKELDKAKEFFDQLELKPFGNAMLYVCDKEGYANCIASRFVEADGSPRFGSPRIRELGTDT